MNLYAVPDFLLLHGQAGFWDESLYVVAAVVGLAVFIAILRKKSWPRE